MRTAVLTSRLLLTISPQQSGRPRSGVASFLQPRFSQASLAPAGTATSKFLGFLRNTCWWRDRTGHCARRESETMAVVETQKADMACPISIVGCVPGHACKAPGTLGRPDNGVVDPAETVPRRCVRDRAFVPDIYCSYKKIAT